jgi:very-short-patch-repair endonuclease
MSKLQIPETEEKSFASHKKSKYWNYEKNILTPRQVYQHTNKKYWFICPDCKHDFETSPNTINHGSWCGFCGNKSLCTNDDCKICYNKSFASHIRSNDWSKKNKSSPRMEFLNSSKHFYFDCSDCNHELYMCLVNIVRLNRSCIYCTNQDLCLNKECLSCYNKSFQSHFNIQYWDSLKNKEIPRRLFKGTITKYWFKCEKNHSFDASLNNITRGRFCPICKNKTEKKMFKWLEKNYTAIKFQPKFKWCRNIQLLPFDFKVNNILIELDGDAHFRQVRNWRTPEQHQERDIYKQNKALENGYSVIRIYQIDVFNDKNDWENKLKQAIDTIQSNSVVYISSNINLYDVYKNTGK